MPGNIDEKMITEDQKTNAVLRQIDLKLADIQILVIDYIFLVHHLEMLEETEKIVLQEKENVHRPTQKLSNE